MRVTDIFLKYNIVKASTTLPLAYLNDISGKQQLRQDYMLRVFNAPIDIQIAVRDAAAADSRSALKQFAGILTALLSPPFRSVTTRLDVPATFPGGSLGQPEGTVIVEDTTYFPTAGTFWIPTSQFYETVIGYTGKTPTSFTGCTGGGGSAGQGNVITARTVSATTPSGLLDMSDSAIQARKDLFIAAFTRRSQNTIGALKVINGEHIWESVQP